MAGKTKKIADLPKLKGIGKPQKTRKLKKFAVRPRGPEHLHLGQHPIRNSGPGEPPVGFVGAHTSRTEWWFYWALATILDDPQDPRTPPFTGSRVGAWFYQVQEQGGRVPAGSVSDFQIKTPTGWIIVRLDTERWHIFAGPNQQMKDLFLKTHIKTGKVITVYEQDFITDESGEAVCRVAALALKGIEMPNPIRTGLAQRRRPYIRRIQ